MSASRPGRPISPRAAAPSRVGDGSSTTGGRRPAPRVRRRPAGCRRPTGRRTSSEPRSCRRQASRWPAPPEAAACSPGRRRRRRTSRSTTRHRPATHAPGVSMSTASVRACVRDMASGRPGWTAALVQPPRLHAAILWVQTRTQARALGAPEVSRYPARMRIRPDVLVLGGGGVLGEAWMMGVLAGIEDAAGFDLRDCEAFVGTSAGAIVAAHLVAGTAPRRPSSVGTELEVGDRGPARGLAVAAVTAARRAGQAALAASATFAPLALGVAAPGGAVVRALLLRGLPRPPDTLSQLRAQVERSQARFDGRLRVTAVDRGSGRRVVFGSPGAPPASVAQAVEASCTVPWLFAPVEIGGREY